MTQDEKTLRHWMKLCLRKNLTPICLVAMSKDGFPHVFTEHDQEVMKKVYEHLLSSPVKDQTAFFPDREN